MRDISDEAFSSVFGAGGAPARCFAPGRVNLIGEHTDYNGGHVFPCALRWGTTAAARPNGTDTFRVYSENMPGGIRTFPAADPVCGRTADWANYPAGVVRMLAERGYILPCGADLYLCGDIPPGGGLSSSASLEVAVGFALKQLFFPELGPEEIAYAGRDCENKFLGVQTGIMDQFASAMCREGCGLYLRTADMTWEQVGLSFGSCRLVLANSNVRHTLAASAYNTRREECAEALRILRTRTDAPSLCALTPEAFGRVSRLLDGNLLKRARHAVTENRRTEDAVAALRRGDRKKFGALMNASHISLRDDYAVTCPELDLLAEEAWRTPGVLGARMTGGGFGGCTVNLVEADFTDAFIGHMDRFYFEKTGIRADFRIAEPGGGVRALE